MFLRADLAFRQVCFVIFHKTQIYYLVKSIESQLYNCDYVDNHKK